MKKKINENIAGVAHTSNLKNKKGITLIALVITIIILLILAGVSIAQLTGNGLFEKAKIAKEESRNAQEDEDDKIKQYSNEINSYVSGNRETITISKEEYDELKSKVDSLRNYSTNEKVVGTWIDGKPIYQKTVLNFAIGTVILSDVDTIVEYDLLYKGDNSSNYYLNSQGWCSGNFIGVALNNGNISINNVGSAYSSGNMLHGTFKYTKTTD